MLSCSLLRKVYKMSCANLDRIGHPRSKSESYSSSFVEEARIMNRNVRLAKTRRNLMKKLSVPLDECSMDDTDGCGFTTKQFCPISSSSDDLQVERTSKSCSNLTSVHGRLGGSVEVKNIRPVNNKYFLGDLSITLVYTVVTVVTSGPNQAVFFVMTQLQFG